MVSKGAIEKISGILNEGTKKDFLKLEELLDDGRFLAYKRKILDDEAKILIAAAKNRQLFYDVSTWSRKVGRGSKPTLSRRKKFLQKIGIIEDEKVPMRYGRPRIRLVLNGARFEEIYQIAI